MRVTGRVTERVRGLDGRVIVRGLIWAVALVVVVSLSPPPKFRVPGSVTLVHGSQWPVSNSVEMFVCSAAQGITFPAAAVENSGWKLYGVPEQLAFTLPSTMPWVLAKPFAADACM